MSVASLTFLHLRDVEVDSKIGIFAVSVKENPAEGDDGVAFLEAATSLGFFESRPTREQLMDDLSERDRESLTSLGAAEPVTAIDVLVKLLEDPNLQFSIAISPADDLQISIKERLQSGIMRVRWTTRLSKTRDESKHLRLSLRLLERSQSLLNQLQESHTRYQHLEGDRDGWKDTAQKLEGEWEKEKTELFHNFCKLYKGKNEHSTQKIEQLESKVHGLTNQVETLRVQASSSSISRARLPHELENLPDDLDANEWDDETIRKYAAGERIPSIIAPPAKRSKKTETKKRLETAKTGEPTKKKKPAKRFIDFEDYEEKKKSAKPPADDDSDTDDDDMIVDREMEAQIAADIAALKK